MTKELSDHILTPSPFPEASPGSWQSPTLAHGVLRAPTPRLQPPLDARGTETPLQGGGPGVASTTPAAEGKGLGISTPDSPFQPPHARGPRIAAGARPAGQAAAAGARRRLAASRAPPAPAGALGRAVLQRGCCGRWDPGGKGRRRGTRGEPPPFPPPSRVRAPTLPFPHPGSQAPVRSGLQAAASEAWGSRPESLAGNPRPRRPPFLPRVRARGAGKSPPKPLASVRAAPTLSQLGRAEKLECRRGAAAVPKALFRRADRAALPWLQTATAREAGRREARHGAGGSSRSLRRGSSAPSARSGRPGRIRSRLGAQLRRDQQ